MAVAALTVLASRAGAQDRPGLFERLTAGENLLFFGRLYGLGPARARSQTERYLRMLGLWERRDDTVGGFSKGMRQKLAIARALLHDPQVVFLDEPTSGLDPNQIQGMRETMRRLGRDKTILLSTHILQEVAATADRVILINEGYKVFDGTISELDPDRIGLEKVFAKLTGHDGTQPVEE